MMYLIAAGKLREKKRESNGVVNKSVSRLRINVGAHLWMLF